MKDAASRLASLVRDVPDFPKPGIIFKDITPVLSSPEGLALAIEAMSAPWAGAGVTKIVCVESRGFIFGTAMAHLMKVGMVPVRKPGKLPYRTRSVSYSLEYGTDTLQMHQDAVSPADRVLIVDDLLATGGTASATARLCLEGGATIVGAAFLIELEFLGGRSKLSTLQRIESVLKY